MAVDFFAGCIGGCAGVIVGHPFDTIKVRLQTQSFSNPIYRGTAHCFSSIVKQESFLGLYKGMASPLYGLAGINAIVFGVQRNLQRRMNNPNTLTSHFIAGSVAGLAQSVICSPMELAKTRMQVQGQGESRHKYRHVRHFYTGPVDCIKKIYTHEGIRGVFRGFGLTVLRETPSFGVYFLSYEYLCRASPQCTADGEVGTATMLFAGGMAGICAWLITYPVDVVKSRVQADMTNMYSGFLDCCYKCYQENGLASFTRGLGSTLLRAFPVNAATFTTVAFTLRTMKADVSDDDAYDFALYVSHHHPPEAKVQLQMANFPSHP